MVKKRRGGQELPDGVQDRPEQNAGYDEAVEFGDALETQDALETESLEQRPAIDCPRLTRRLSDDEGSGRSRRSDSDE